MDNDTKKSEPTRSIEHFHHFRCGFCDGWWGIGDAPDERENWFCPWCGKENEYKKIEEAGESNDRHMTLKETYNRIAEEWHQEHQSDDWWVEGTDRFASMLHPGADVLDAGCGGGTKSKYLVEKGLSVVGIDFSEKLIEIAKREVPEASFLVCDLGEMDKLDGMYDGVFMQAVLLHIPKKDVTGILRKAASRLKPGGILYAAVKEQREGQDEEEVKMEDNFGYPYERFFSYFTQEEMENFVRAAGLELIHSDVKPSGSIHWIQVMGRRAVDR